MKHPANPSLLRILAILLLASVCLSVPLAAKNKDKTDAAGSDETTGTQAAQASPAPDTETDIDFDWSSVTILDFWWHDMDADSGVTDWAAAKGGPSLENESTLSADIKPSGLPWLSTGPELYLHAKAGTTTQSSLTTDPTLSMDSIELRALAGWSLDGKFKPAPGTRFNFHVGLSGGLDLVELTDADYTLLPSGTSAENYWYRVLPVLASTQKLGFSSGIFNARVENFLAFRFNTDNAVDDGWEKGMEDKLDLKAGITLALDKEVDLKTTAFAGADWASNFLVPTEKFDAGIKLALDFEDCGSIEMVPVQYRYEAEVPGFDQSLADDESQQLLGRLAWSPDAAKGGFGASLTFPWAAFDGEGTRDETLGLWKFELTWNLVQ